MQSMRPQRIDNSNWYYEEKRGIEVIHEVYASDEKDVKYLRTDHIMIPWAKLRKSLARKDAAPKKNK